MGFADGHVHAGFVKKADALVTRFAYFQRQGVKAICLSLPLDGSRTADLKARISGEIARELARRGHDASAVRKIMRDNVLKAFAPGA